MDGGSEGRGDGVKAVGHLGGETSDFVEELSLFMFSTIIWKAVIWTWALMLIGACVLPGQRLMDRKPRSQTQLLQEINTKGLEKKC